MRELAVYYCRKCGYYGFYQLPRNAVCPKCAEKMALLPLHYLDFMKLDCQERDELLSREILESSSSIVSRLVLPHQQFNQREIIAKLTLKIEELEKENHKLSDTVSWMHETIWDLIKRNRT